MKHKSIPIFTVLSRAVFVILLILNFLLNPVSQDDFKICFWNVICVCVWGYAFAGSFGLIKTIVSEEDDGVIVYDTPVPIIQIGILRILEFAYFYWRFREVINYRYFIVLVVADLLYLVLLLFDKASYDYISIEEEKDLWST